MTDLDEVTNRMKESASNGVGAGMRAEQGTETEALVLEIMKHYSHPSGRIDWKRAFREHPEYKYALKADTEEGRLKMKLLARRFRQNQPKANLSSEERAQAQELRETSLPPEQRAVLGAARRYCNANGAVDWERAYREMPELAQLLPERQRAYGIQTQLRKWGLLRNQPNPYASKNKTRKSHHKKLERALDRASIEAAPRVEPDPAPAPAPEPETKRWPLNYCPGCGIYLIGYIMGAEFTAKHVTK